MGDRTGVSVGDTARPYCSTCGGTNLRNFGWYDPHTEKKTSDLMESLSAGGPLKMLPVIFVGEDFHPLSGNSQFDQGDASFCIDCESWRECDWRDFTPPERGGT